MRPLKPLPPGGASRTLVNRFARRVDSARQLLTKVGARPYRVFLVWEGWSGDERGEGTPTILRREEILPTPNVESLESISITAFSAGVLPVGTVRVTQVSPRYTSDFLLGLLPEYTDNTPERSVKQPIRFFYEVVEDGRTTLPCGCESTCGCGAVAMDAIALTSECTYPDTPEPAKARTRYRLSTPPVRRATKFDWILVLERTSEDLKRDGTPNTTEDVNGRLQGPVPRARLRARRG